MANAFGRTYSTRQTAEGANIYDLGGRISAQETAPTDGLEGDLWFSKTIGELFVYIDGTGWVQANGGVSGGDMLLMPSYIGPTVSGEFANVNNNSGYVTVINTSQEVRLGNFQSSPRALGLSSPAVISVRIWGSVDMQAGGEADRLSPRVYMGTEPNPSSTGTQIFPSARPWGNSTSTQTYDVTITDAFEMQPWDGGDATRVYIFVSNNGNNSTGSFNIDYWIKDANFNIIQNTKT